MTEAPEHGRDANFEVVQRRLSATQTEIRELLERHGIKERLHPDAIRDGTYLYLRSGGKAVRPALLRACCEAVGGKSKLALPAAASLELYHTWTLVHDDLIDRDERRRGGPTVHAEFSDVAKKRFEVSGETADHYGQSMGILVGDILHGWSVHLLLESIDRGVRWEVVNRLLRRLEFFVLPELVEGEVLDVNFSLLDPQDLTEEEILDMLWKKTGVLYEFAGYAGAEIGFNETEEQRLSTKIGEFAGMCGTAFQIQDDILGAVGDPAVTGKPVGADIREGKKTLLILEALNEADSNQLERLDNALGSATADEAEIEDAIQVLEETGAVGTARRRALSKLEEAHGILPNLPTEGGESILRKFSEFMVHRIS